MAYTEVQVKDGNKYYYKTKSIREGNKVKKSRVYLGKNLTIKKLKKLEGEIDIELGYLIKLLSKKEIKSLENIKKQHQKDCKKDFQLKYESFISKFTYDTNAIEGSTLTLNETSAILFENLTPKGKTLREVNEAINHKKAFDFMLEYKGEIDKKFICELQSLIVENTLKKEIENQIGVYRTLQVYIRGANFIPPKPNDVKKEMNALIKWHKKNKEKLHPVLVASYFHCAFESIHPFADGNGRTGRLLINFILHKAGFPMINIPIKRRLDYYEALETARNGNLRDFIKIIISLMSTKDYII